jgi:hypothetical protein
MDCRSSRRDEYSSPQLIERLRYAALAVLSVIVEDRQRLLAVPD